MRNLLTALLIGFMGSSLWAADTVEVLEVRGEAAIRTGLEGEWTPLLKGALIEEGQWIQTNLGSRVYLRFWDNTITQVRSASLVKLETARSKGLKQKGRLRLALGAVKVNVKHDRKEIVDFRVESPKLTTAVKGTQWLQTTNSLEVLRGKVAAFVKGFPGMHRTPTDHILDAARPTRERGESKGSREESSEEEESLEDAKCTSKKATFDDTVHKERRVEDKVKIAEQVSSGESAKCNKPK